VAVLRGAGTRAGDGPLDAARTAARPAS